MPLVGKLWDGLRKPHLVRTSFGSRSKREAIGLWAIRETVRGGHIGGRRGMVGDTVDGEMESGEHADLGFCCYNRIAARWRQSCGISSSPNASNVRMHYVCRMRASPVRVLASIWIIPTCKEYLYLAEDIVPRWGKLFVDLSFNMTHFMQLKCANNMDAEENAKCRISRILHPHQNDKRIEVGIYEVTIHDAAMSISCKWI